MSNTDNGQKISYVRFHEGLFFPEFGNIGVVMPPPNKTMAGLEMFYDKQDVTIFYRGKKIAVPAANVAAVQYADGAAPTTRTLAGEVVPKIVA